VGCAAIEIRGDGASGGKNAGSEGNRRTRTWRNLRLTAHMEQLGIFKPFHLCGMCAIGFLFWIFFALRGRGDKEVDIFDQDFHRLIAQVHPMERKREFSEVA
jgi:hypothetical protein